MGFRWRWRLRFMLFLIWGSDGGWLFRVFLVGRRTADPSLRSGWISEGLLLSLGVCSSRGVGTADPSTALRFGRDDKFVALVGSCDELRELQNPRLRSG